MTPVFDGLEQPYVDTGLDFFLVYRKLNKFLSVCNLFVSFIWHEK